MCGDGQQSTLTLSGVDSGKRELEYRIPRSHYPVNSQRFLYYLRGNHLSNATRLTQVFFTSGE